MERQIFNYHIVNKTNMTTPNSNAMYPFTESIMKSAFTDYTVTIVAVSLDPNKIDLIKDTSCKDVSCKRHSSFQSSHQSKVQRL